VGEIIDFNSRQPLPVPNNDGPNELEEAFNSSLVHAFKLAYEGYLANCFSPGEHTVMAEWFMLMGATLLMEELGEKAIVDSLKVELDRVRDASQ
jgi:hypothetical protein